MMTAASWWSWGCDLAEEAKSFADEASDELTQLRDDKAAMDAILGGFGL